MRPTWLFINLALDFGGHEVMLLRWIEELQRQGDLDPVLVCTAGTRLALLGASRLPTYEVAAPTDPAASKLRKLVRFGKLVLRLGKVKRMHRPRLAIVAEGCLMAQRHGLFASRVIGLRSILYVPIVTRFVDMGIPDAQRLERTFRRFYRKLPAAWLTITEQQADELRSWSAITQPIFCLPNTVSEDFRSQMQPPSTNGSEERAVRSNVLVLGRLDAHQKGIDLVIRHLQHHPELMHEIHVTFVGEGPYRATIQTARYSSPALANLITVEPWQDSRCAFARHDVLLIASRFEGVPLVMLEAMACAVPVVATDLPGTRSYLPPSCLFVLGDLERAFNTVRWLRCQRDMREVIVQANLRSSAARASPQAFSDAVRRLSAELGVLRADPRSAQGVDAEHRKRPCC